MPIKILMPALSPTMTEGTLASWQKKEGDEVNAGDVIAEIETDKATMEVEAVDEGVIGRILVPEGTEGVPVNEVIALLLEEGEDSSALDTAVASGGNGATSTGNGQAATAAPAPPGGAPASTAAPAAAPPRSAGDRIFAS
ncbi:MAG: biotin/lipoyl-containing protein, partial [Alphaproteobacteria bacterium]